MQFKSSYDVIILTKYWVSASLCAACNEGGEGVRTCVSLQSMYWLVKYLQQLNHYLWPKEEAAVIIINRQNLNKEFEKLI